MRALACSLLVLLSACEFSPEDLAPFPCKVGQSCPGSLQCHQGQCMTAAMIAGGSGITGTTGTSANTTFATTIGDTSLALDATYVYFHSFNAAMSNVAWEVARVPKAGGTKQVLASGSAPATGPFKKGIIVSNGYVYWASATDQMIKRVPVDGGAYSDFAPCSTYGGERLFVHTTWLYWADAGIRSCSQGMGCTSVPTAGLPGVTGFVVDIALSGDQLAWLEPGPPHVVRTCTLPNCSTISVAGSFTAQNARALFTDTTNAFVWTQAGAVGTQATLMRCPLSGAMTSCAQVSALSTSVYNAGVATGPAIYFLEDDNFYTASGPAYSSTQKLGSFNTPFEPDLVYDDTSFYLTEVNAIAKIPR
jgi:hypothetical protein